jgi:opacity protein-like surface antigen
LPPRDHFSTKKNKEFNMRNLILAATLAMSVTAAAQSRRISASDYRGSSSSGQHAVSGAFGFYNGSGLLIDTSKTAGAQSDGPTVSGFFGIGGDYEYVMANDFTVGGLFRYYSTSDSVSSSVEQRVAGWHIGGMAKCYLTTENFAPYIGAGLGIINLSVKRTSAGTSTDIEATSLGFTMALGVLYKFSDTMQFGVENLRAWGLGEKMQGMPINDFMFKGRFML